LLILYSAARDSRKGKSGFKQLEYVPLLEITKKFLSDIPKRDTNHTYWWNELVEQVMPLDPPFSAKLAAEAIVSDDISFSFDAKKLAVVVAKAHPDLFLSAISDILRDEKKALRFIHFEHREVISEIPSEALDPWLSKEGINAARAIARSLPGPIESEDDVRLPEITELVFAKFGEDEEVFQNFCMGVDSRMYSGDIAAQHDHEAEISHRFIHHKIPSIRRWALYREKNAKAHAKWERQRREEEFLD
jgi:hypothetical protein